LREVSLRETHPFLRKDLGYLQQASYCSALIEQVTETETPMPAIFDLLSDFLNHLGAQPLAPQTVFTFELKLLNELGLKPDLARTNLTIGAQQIVQALAESDWGAISRLKLSVAQAGELRRFLQGFQIFHFGKLPGSRGQRRRRAFSEAPCESHRPPKREIRRPRSGFGFPSASGFGFRNLRSSDSKVRLKLLHLGQLRIFWSRLCGSTHLPCSRMRSTRRVKPLRPPNVKLYRRFAHV